MKKRCLLFVMTVCIIIFIFGGKNVFAVPIHGLPYDGNNSGGNLLNPSEVPLITQQGTGISITSNPTIFKFIPTNNATYIIETTTDGIDSRARLFDGTNLNDLGGNKIAENDDSTAENWNFQISYLLTADTTYYVIIEEYGDIDCTLSIIGGGLVGIITTNSNATSITSTSAVVGGNVRVDGGLPVIARGVEYKKHTDGSYTQAPADTVDTGNFNVSLSGLETGTTYDVRAYATNDGGISYGDVIQFTTLANAASIAATTGMTETNLDTNSIDVTLIGETFIGDGTLDKANFTLDNAPAGLTIESLDYTDTTHCTVNLAYEGTDFDNDITNLGLTISGAELSGGSALTASNQLTINATNDPESISISDDGNIIEGAEDGEGITVTLTDGTFNNPINPDNWTVTNLPVGVSRGSVTRIDANHVQITLLGNATEEYDTNITNVTVDCTTDEYSDSSGGAGLSANSGITLIANNGPEVTTVSPATSIAPTSATVSGNITSNGGLPITERGIEYKKNTDGVYTKVAEGGTAVGAYSVNLTGLEPATNYDVRAYAINGDGPSYGAVASFTTTNTPPTISDITDKTTNEDTATTNMSFTVGDGETAANSLSISATSDNTTLIPGAGYVFGGSGANRTLTITPALNQYGTATVTVTVADGNGATAQDTFVLTVNPVNDAPVLVPSSYPLTIINEDSTNNTGQTVASFAGASITDVDSGSVNGIAIIGTTVLDGSGTWQYSTDNGGTWTSIGTISESSALLLRTIDKVRFVPNGQNGTMALITYRAWDQTSGIYGDKVDTTINGGISTFSASTDSASILVISVNDAPVLLPISPSLITISADNTSDAGQTVASFIGASISDIDNGALKGIALTSTVNGNGTWAYSTDNGGMWTSVGAVAGDSALLLRDTDKVRFVPDGQNGTTASITYRAWDQTSGTADTTTNGGISAFSTATDTANITVNKIPPRIQSVGVPANDTYKTGENLDFTVNFNENVNVIGIPQLSLDIGGVTRTATYVSGSGTSALTFRYTVQAGDIDSDGIDVNSLELNGGTIRDSVGNDADLTLNSVGTTTWVTVDALVPTITTANLSADNTYIDITFDEGIYGANDGVTALTADKFELTFTKNTGTATNVTISSIKKNDNAVEASASALTGGETTVRIFLNVAGTPNGVETIEIKSKDGSSIYDKAGNEVLLTETTGLKGLKDKLAPTFNPVTGTALDTTKKVVTLTFNENVVNALIDLDELKNSVTFAADGTNYSALGSNDTVAITSGKLVVTFENALSGSTSKIRISANSLKDESENLLTEVVTINAIVITTVPSAPTGVSATAGNRSAVISFAAPVDNGGSTITSYTVTSNPGSITATGNGSPITITGLTNGVTYTFTVTAINAIGTGVSSLASNSVIPSSPSSGGGSSGGTQSGTNQQQITVDVTNGTTNNSITQTQIQRTTEADGTKKDEVQYSQDKAQETVAKLKEEGKDIARIVIPDKKDEVSESRINVPTTTISIIAEGNINLQIDTENARINIPKESIQGLNEDLKEDLFFKIIPLKEEEQKREVIERAKKEEVVRQVVGNRDISILGRPMTIETNMSQRTVDIVLPLKNVTIPQNPKEREEFLNKLGIFIEHSDGQKVLIKGEIVEYKDDVLGIKFSINKFSTFTIVKLNEGEFKENVYDSSKTFMRDKEIKITFNRDLNKDSLTKDSIYVEDSKGNKVETILKYNSIDKVVTVIPSKYYNSGQTYYLYVTDTLISTSGKLINRKVKYIFKIGE